MRTSTVCEYGGLAAQLQYEKYKKLLEKEFARIIGDPELGLKEEAVNLFMRDRDLEYVGPKLGQGSIPFTEKEELSRLIETISKDSSTAAKRLMDEGMFERLRQILQAREILNNAFDEACKRRGQELIIESLMLPYFTGNEFNYKK